MTTSLKQHLDGHLSMDDQKVWGKTVGELNHLHLSSGEAAKQGTGCRQDEVEDLFSALCASEHEEE